MKLTYTRRHFVKQTSAIALVFFILPSKKIKNFLRQETSEDSVACNIVQTIPFPDIQIQGELLTRALRNYDRLEDDIYKPYKDFNAGGASEGWPGDKEGRIILGLTLQAQATHREPKYLEEIINLIPQYLNKKGYLGPVLENKIMEQQLSGHGWFLRGLCEYYLWKKNPRVKKYIGNIIQNLVLPTSGYHKNYPIDIESRKKDVGEAAGTTLNTVGKWMLSSDIGCDFILLDGVVQAYTLFPSNGLKSLIEEMIDRFLQMDMAAINAQTHAALTALRGILRYYKITGKPDLLNQAEKRYILYRKVAMTENYENYNWFGRPEWTEPCGIIDSFMVAVQLWQYTGNPLYLEDAHLIYYNALSHTQRTNGGFGLDNCPGPVTDTLKVYADEAYWCCTMRGGEGLAKAIQYNYFVGTAILIIPFYNSSKSAFTFGNKKVIINQLSGYPFENKVIFKVLDAENSPDILLKLFSPSWMTNHQVTINGSPQPFKKENRFISFKIKLKKGTTIVLSFDQKISIHNMVNMEHSMKNYCSISYGPLLLGYDGDNKISFDEIPQIIRQSDKEWTVKDKEVLLSTVYHLMDSKVSKGTGYHKQILFKT